MRPAAYGSKTGTPCVVNAALLRKWTQRLLAGIASTMGSANPCAMASVVTASRSRTPQAGLLRRKSASNAALLGAVGGRRGGTARRGKACRPRVARRGAAHEPAVAAHGAMWIMLMHTTASARGDRPRSAAASSAKRGHECSTIRIAAHASMLARACGSGSLGWNRRPGDARDVQDVLARSAGDLQHETALGSSPQHGPDRLAVASRRRRELACIAAHALLPQDLPTRFGQNDNNRRPGPAVRRQTPRDPAHVSDDEVKLNVSPNACPISLLPSRR